MRKLPVLLLFFAQPVLAATIEVIPQPGTTPAFILVQGLLQLEDIEEFQFKVANIPKAVVVLDSDGGRLLAGIRIGTLIRLRKFVTLVPSGATCASSCGFAWLGGAHRFMAIDARVGFHAAYRNESGQPTETGVGNAVLGAYLSQIGLSETAIVYVTKAPPRGMTWLTFSEAARHQIEVKLFAPASEPSVPAPAPKKVPPPHRVLGPIADLEQRTRSFVASLHATWSAPALNVQQALQQIYADRVFYYGKDVHLRAIIDDKRRFVSRWPQRKYDLREPSLDVRCSDTSVCTAVGLVDWGTFNPATMARARGIAKFHYAVEWSASGPRITMETGSVVERENSDASALRPVAGAGWWVVLASFGAGNNSGGAADINASVKRTIGAAYLCGFSAFSDSSSKFSGFAAGYTVVVVGPFIHRTEAEQAQQRIGACASGSAVRYANHLGE